MQLLLLLVMMSGEEGVHELDPGWTYALVSPVVFAGEMRAGEKEVIEGRDQEDDEGLFLAEESRQRQEDRRDSHSCRVTDAAGAPAAATR